MIKSLTAIAALALTAATAHAAFAPAPLKGDAAVAATLKRHAGYGEIGKAMRSAKKGIDGGDVAAIRAGAATIDRLAPVAATWFPRGTAMGEVTLPGGHKVGAKPEIWAQPAQFAAVMKNFRVAAANFNRTAAGTNMAATTAAFGALGGTCKACHEKFRAE